MTHLLTAEEVAGMFGVRARTVWAWVRQGRLHTVRTPGGRMRFTDDAVRAARGEGRDDEDPGPGGDGTRRAPYPLPAPAPPARRPGCGWPYPEDFRTRPGWCHCGALWAVH